MKSQNSKTSSLWAFAPAVLLTSMVGGLGTMAYIASSDPSFAVERDYYKKAVHWDEQRAQESLNLKLGWRIEAREERRDTRTGLTEFTFRVSDMRGEPVRNGELTVTTFHNARAGETVERTTKESAPGEYKLQLPMKRPGLWELRLSIVRPSERFTRTLRLEVAGEGGV